MKTKGYRPSAPLPHAEVQPPQGTLDQLEDGATQGAQALAVRSAVIVERSASPAYLSSQPAVPAGVLTNDDSAWLAWSQQTLVLRTEANDVELPVPLALYRLCLAWVERREAKALDPQDGRVLVQVQGTAAQGVPGLVELLSAMFKLHLAELPRQAMWIVREHAAQAPAPIAAGAAPAQQVPQAVEPGDDSESAEERNPLVSTAPAELGHALPSRGQGQAEGAEAADTQAQGESPLPEALESPAPLSDARSVPAQDAPEAAEAKRERAADRRRRRGPPID